MRNFNLIFSVGLVVFFMALLPSETDASESTNRLYTVYCLVSYCMCMYTWLHKGNRLYSLFMLFIIYSMFSNLGQSILYLCGYSPSDLLVYSRESIADINTMLLFQGLCISTMNLGVAIYFCKSSHTLSLDDQIRLQNQASRKHKSSYNWFLNNILWVSLFIAVFNCIKMIVLRQEVDYMELYNIRTSEGGGNVLLNYLSYLSIFLALRLLFLKRHVKLIVFTYLFLIIGYMVTGSRGLAFPYIAVLIAIIPGLFPKYFRGHYNTYWFLLVLGLLIVSGLISTTRSASLTAVGTIDDSAFDMIKGAVSEMGASARPTVVTMVANDKGFPHIQSILYLITFILPFTNKIPLLESQGIVLSDWVTVFVGSDSGLGYSFIAEAYMNYGWYGCIFTGLYGWFIAFAENSSYKKIASGGLFLGIVLLIVLCKQIFYARAELILLGSTLRFSLYTAIIYYLLLLKNKIK